MTAHRTPAPSPPKSEPYIRTDDGARMIEIEPGYFVNEAVWRRLGAVR